jgi:shikimate kinase
LRSVKHNLVLTGFMGTGKSAVGPLVAGRLGMRFVDMDPTIEARTGLTVSEIFRARGEAAFREMEAALCRELAAQRGLVIATGGGALLVPANRAALGATALIVCLTCAVDEILARLARAADRPLLEAADRAARVRALLEARAPVYAGLPAHVDTTGLTPPQVAERVVELWEARR